MKLLKSIFDLFKTKTICPYGTSNYLLVRTGNYYQFDMDMVYLNYVGGGRDSELTQYNDSVTTWDILHKVVVF